MKIHEILRENIFTTDYHKVMQAVAELYQGHYDVNIWENGDAHDEAAKVLMKEHPNEKSWTISLRQDSYPSVSWN